MAVASAQVLLNSADFRREREGSWRELEYLLERVERAGLKALSAPELERLPILYRHALSSLSVARAISLDTNLIEYLDSLARRAYFSVYCTRKGLRGVIASFFGTRLPATVRRNKWFIIVSALAMILGAVASFALVTDSPDRYYALVTEDMAQGRTPAATTDELRSALYDDHHQTDDLGDFAGQLFAHNARIGIVAFAVGFLLGVPTLLLLFINGLNLGAFAALYHGRDLSYELWGWLLPHGVTELLAVILCGGAGLMLAHSLIFPGQLTRLANLARRGRDAAVIVIGATLMFLLAGLLEGLFRQLVTDDLSRYTAAIGTATVWLLYFGFIGRGRSADGG